MESDEKRPSKIITADIRINTEILEEYRLAREQHKKLFPWRLWAWVCFLALVNLMCAILYFFEGDL